MQQRLNQLSNAARQVVQVAAVLPDRFSARLLAAMLERRPAALVSAVEEAVRADLLIEDSDQMRFRHDLLREATRQSLSLSLRRAMERQSATIMLDMGAAPEEVATQLARSAEVGDQAAIAALRQAAQSVANSDPSAAVGFEQARVGAPAPRRPGMWATRDRNDRAAQSGHTLRGGATVGQHHPVCHAGARRRGQDSPPAPDGNHRYDNATHRREPPRTSVAPPQRRHPGTTSGMAGVQPGDVRPTRAGQRGSQRGGGRRRIHRRSRVEHSVRSSTCLPRLRERVRGPRSTPR